jgi:hypothetical protein
LQGEGIEDRQALVVKRCRHPGSIQGKALSWPTARMTSSQGIKTGGRPVDCQLPGALVVIAGGIG